jgi:hypothetical protein
MFKLINMPESYIFHTSRLTPVKEGRIPASTVALKKQGNHIIFGISMCSKDDNFSRKFGREAAERRMNEGFASFEIKNVSPDATDHEICMFHLYNIVQSVTLNNRRWRKKIARHNAEVLPEVAINTVVL